jgi:hypothetical protein
MSARVGGEGLALGVVGALALAAAAASRMTKARGSANLSPARREAFDALAEAYRDYASQFDFASILDIHRFAQANGLTFLGDGWSRAVFSVPEGALKIAKSSGLSFGGQSPFDENRKEVEIYQSAPASIARHLVPILDHAKDYAWVLMPKVETGGALDEEVSKALSACGVGDFTTRNTSRDGQVVDYAAIISTQALADCLARGRAQRSASGSAARSRGSRSEISHGKAWAELHEDLSEIGRGVLGEQILSTTLKTCSSTAPAVMQYLLERGHVVEPGGRDRPSGYTHHYDLAVLTSDRGWLNVDPTFMQFHCKHQPSEDEEEGEDWSDLAELKRHLQTAWADPMATYRIDPLPWPPAPRGGVEVKAPPTLSKVGSWAEYWEKYKRLATSAVDKARRETAGEDVGRFKPGPYAYLISS